MRRVLGTLVVILLALPAHAGEIGLLGGYGWTDKPLEKTYAWQVQYMEGLGDHLAYSLSYVNQGHFIEHHRDGYAANLWARTNLMERRLSLGLGLGGIFYFDTINPATGPSRDYHGWGGMTSLAATWYTESRLFYQLQGYYVRGDKSFNTLSVLAGIGYQLDAPPVPGPDVRGAHQSENTTENEITLVGGETVVNIPGRGKSAAFELEYRRGIWRYLEVSAGALYEGRNDLIDRYGLTTQLWLAKRFLDDRISLGAGLGGYFAVDQRRGDSGTGRNAFVSELASISGSLQVSRHYTLRATFHRVISTYNRDSDIFLGGIGYQF
ncbi:hypothetical protein [Geomesophilobacter sediminis]|uniref:Outer membrane protein beta-barrel domain-containing protein n=1 Tax=Geomesophilobacter sediminis TaxID=2798584 RepID=A0A8J7M0H5_9BACT|nr:hypothetical protein [Geomesophilobacter sediminis]MBJ6725217.1 hypothetical protein [Geomesophilobacter sediminis]